MSYKDYGWTQRMVKDAKDRGIPIAGAYRGRKNGKTETRHVYDFTFGNDIHYRIGRWNQCWRGRCTLEEWNIWIKEWNAKLIG